MQCHPGCCFTLAKAGSFDGTVCLIRGLIQLKMVDFFQEGSFFNPIGLPPRSMSTGASIKDRRGGEQEDGSHSLCQLKPD